MLDAETLMSFNVLAQLRVPCSQVRWNGQLTLAITPSTVKESAWIEVADENPLLVRPELHVLPYFFLYFVCALHGVRFTRATRLFNVHKDLHRVRAILTCGVHIGPIILFIQLLLSLFNDFQRILVHAHVISVTNLLVAITRHSSSSSNRL